MIAYLAPILSPKYFFIPAIFGLAFPILLIANLLFLIYWVSLKKIQFLLSGIILLLGWSHISGFFQINFPTKLNNSENEIKILSYNVRLFDLYNWSNNIETRNKIFGFVKNQHAEILCFQEFYHEKSDYFPTLDTLLQFQQAKNAHVAYTVINKNKYYFGIATLSKFPIIKRGRIKFDNTKNVCIYTDIKILNDTIRVYNSHLESIHFQDKNYNFIDSITYKNEDERLEGIKDILLRLKNAFVKRAGQTEIIAEHIKLSPYPVLVCGDFNDTPVSYAYGLMSEGLKDAFREAGLGFGTTYNRNFSFLRIDYLLHSPEIEFLRFKTIKKKYSDHYPIMGIFEIQKTNE